MTANFTNSPNLNLVAKTLARLIADRVGGEVQEVTIKMKNERDEIDESIRAERNH